MITLSLLEEKKINEYFDSSEYNGDNLYPKLDLMSNIWVIDYDKIIVDAVIRVDKSTEMRIDTIARYVLGREDYIDVIVKYNNILNPYGIKDNDIIYVPNLNSFFANIKKANYKSKDIKSSLQGNGIVDIKKGTSVSVKKNGQGTKSYRKGENGVIVF